MKHDGPVKPGCPPAAALNAAEDKLSPAGRAHARPCSENNIDKDEFFMRQALKQAQKAAEKDEVPVGALVVKNGAVIARGYNSREKTHDPSGHAEINALRRAAKKLGGWNLHDCELYVTLEPCPMCAGAAINARIARIIYGASDVKAGACGSKVNLCEPSFKFNHIPGVTGGVLKDECAFLLTKYFKLKRRKKEER